MTRRLLITIEADGTTCKGCTCRVLARKGQLCTLFNWRRLTLICDVDHVPDRPPECLEAEAAAERAKWTAARAGFSLGKQEDEAANKRIDDLVARHEPKPRKKVRL